MQCHKCLSDSRIVSHTKGGKLVRECENRHRWMTVRMEIRDTQETPPATPETIWAMKADGLSIRAIARALIMSSSTVQKHLDAAPSLEKVWS